MAVRSKRKNNNSAVVAIVISVIVIILAAATIIFFGGDGGGILGKIRDDIVGNDVNGAHNGLQLDLIDSSDLPDSTTPVQETDAEGDTVITLSDSGITIDGQGAVAEGSYLKIVSGGTYIISGTLSDGRIAVRAQGEDVVLILNGVNVNCSNSAALYVNKAKSVTLLLNGTTENIFTDGSSYDYTLEYGDASNDEPNACIYSKDDLIIRGTGSLRVNGIFNSGIIGKDTLKILNTTVEVNAKNNGINGKDSLTIQNSTVSVTAGGDALRSTQDNDPTLGWASLSGSNIYLTATDGDGMQIERGITIDNCSISITTGNNGAKSTITESSTKGIKCSQGYIMINSGTIVIDSYDDAIHCAGDITVNGGTLSIATGDDAIHSDANIYINDGLIEIPESHEGLEAALIEISGGEIYIVADDDGINASGGNDASSKDVKNLFMSDGSYLGITGGYIYINAQGDGIDSNGDIYMSGGTLIISGPTSSADGAIDYNGDFHMDGGMLFAAGASGMAEAPDNMTINVLSITFDRALAAGDYVCISGGGKEFVFRVDKQTENIVFGSPELETGAEYTVSYGGKYSGEVKDCIASGGKYSGGTELATVTLTAGLNYYGRVGIGGSMGGNRFGNDGQFGGFGGEGNKNPFGGGGRGGMDGRPGGFDGGQPPHSGDLEANEPPMQVPGNMGEPPTGDR